MPLLAGRPAIRPRTASRAPADPPIATTIWRDAGLAERAAASPLALTEFFFFRVTNLARGDAAQLRNLQYQRGKRPSNALMRPQRRPVNTITITTSSRTPSIPLGK